MRSTFALCLLLLGGRAVCATPQPLPVQGSLRAEGIRTDRASGQIESVECGPGRQGGPVVFSEAPGESFTLSLWLNVSDAALLAAAQWDARSPMSIAELSGAGGRERLVIRLQQGRIVVAGTVDNGRKWAHCGTAGVVEAGRWYLLSVVRAGGRTALYVNNSFAASSEALPAMGGITSATFGSSQRSRFLHGTILQPRLYRGVLPRAAIHDLFLERPASIQNVSPGLWRLK